MASTLYFNPNQAFHSPQQFNVVSHRADQPASPYFYLDQSALNTVFVNQSEMMPISKASRMRHKSNSPLDQVKHRRTRSGCLTCRQRRVKCDETRPICERCKKGGRECSFPEASISKSSSASGSSRTKKEKRTVSSSTSIRGISSSPEVDAYDDGDEYWDYLDEESLSYTDDFGHRLLAPSGYSEQGGLGRTIAQLYLEERSPSPNDIHLTNEQIPNNTSPFYNLHTVSTLHLMTTGAENSENQQTVTDFQLPTHLPVDVRFYLEYYRQNISSFHYSLKLDPSDFFRRALLTYAVESEALLYAIVAFSAFHYHVDHNSSHYGDFLEYHNKAVALLRTALNDRQEPDLSMLLTILQIASFEERLGDWASLSQHRRGAHMILVSLFTPDTMYNTPASTMIFAWFARLDIFVTQISADETLLGLDWYEHNKTHFQIELGSRYGEPVATLHDAEASVRYLSMKVANLLALRQRRQIGEAEFGQKALMIQQQMDSFWSDLHPLLSAVHQFIAPFLPSLREEDVQANHDNCSMVQEEQLVPASYIIAEIHALNLMIGHHVAMSDRSVEQGFMHNNALAICKIFTALECHSPFENSTLLPLLTCLGMAAIWMPDHQFRSWFRSKFMGLENMGFIFPSSFRLYLVGAWNEPDLQSSWLPYQVGRTSYPYLNNGIITSIRNLAGIRDMESNSAHELYQDSIQIKGIFGILS